MHPFFVSVSFGSLNLCSVDSFSCNLISFYLSTAIFEVIFFTVSCLESTRSRAFALDTAATTIFQLDSDLLVSRVPKHFYQSNQTGIFSAHSLDSFAAKWSICFHSGSSPPARCKPSAPFDLFYGLKIRSLHS